MNAANLRIMLMISAVGLTFVSLASGAIGDPCRADLDCRAVANTSCIKKVCSCSIGYYAVASDTCARRKLNDSCFTNPDCNAVMPHSRCNHIRRCVCSDDYFAAPDGMQCIESRIGITPCIADSQCLESFNNTVCTDGLCRCTSLYNQNSDNNSCILNTVGSSCLDNSNCLAVQNANCSDNQCACLPGHKPINSTVCLPRYLGERCCSTFDCSVVANSLCRTSDNTCACISGYLDSAGSGRACNRRLTTDNCTAHADCAATFTFSTCTEDGLCQCLPGYKFSRDLESCEPLRLNDQCSRAEDCTTSGIHNINCTGGVCKCLSGFEPTPALTDCQKKSIESVICTTDSDCLVFAKNSNCVQRNCTCAKGFHVSHDNSSCVINQVTSKPDSCARNECTLHQAYGVWCFVSTGLFVWLACNLSSGRWM